MTPSVIAESVVEEATLDWLRDFGYNILYGPDIAPEEVRSERSSYQDVILDGRLRAAIDKLNPTIPADAREQAFKKLTRTESSSLFMNNYDFHKMGELSMTKCGRSASIMFRTMIG